MTDPTLILTSNPDFSDLALAELKKAQPQAEVLGALAPGVWLVTAVSFYSLAQAWQHRPPIFVRHISPVYFKMERADFGDDVGEICERVCLQMVDWVDATLSLAVQTRLFADVSFKAAALNTAVAERLHENSKVALDVANPQQIISIVIGSEDIFSGISLAQQNLSSWAGGRHRFAREAGQISRAEFKLLETIEWFGIELPQAGQALDLGAAPGGWTRVLRQRGLQVTAVDPAKLHPTLQQDKHVQHLPITTETFLAQRPLLYDFIVNDMRLDAKRSARLMVDLAGCLKSRGQAVMTLKLPAKKRQAIIADSSKILSQAYVIKGARQLFHNRSEITLFLERTF